MFSKRFVWILLLVLVFAGCSSQSSARGQGIQVDILNRASLADIYAPIGSSDRPLNSQQRDVVYTSNQGETFTRIAQMDLLIQNTGYADSVAAVYVGGYDPNLFYVRPQGPFFRQEGDRFCYKDLFLEDQLNYAVSAVCAVNEDLILGGGISREGDSVRLNVDAFLSNLGARMSNSDSLFFQTFGTIVDNARISCSVPVDGDGLASGSCSFTSSFLEFLNRRSSRGMLLLALYGDQVADCKNGCVVVPSPRLPRNFIAGDSSEFPGGEIYSLPMDIMVNEQRWPSNYETQQQTFQVTACYLYTTYATPQVCVDPTPSQSDGDVCRPGVQRINHGQPAPLRIDRIEQVNQGPRIMFTIHVENAMQGTVFNPGAIDYCAPGAPETYAREVRNVAKVIDARILGELNSLDCRDGTIRLDRSGRGQISCFYDIPQNARASGAYQTSLNIEIGYLYRDIQTVQARISRI